MPDIAEILKSAAHKRKEEPLSANGMELFTRGHLTADELEVLTKGERMQNYINKHPEQESGNSGLILPESATTKVPATLMEKVVQQAESYIDQCLEAWMPKQIDHVVIRASRKPPEIPAPGCSEYNAQISVHIHLLNVLKQTGQVMATDIGVTPPIKLEEAAEKEFWEVLMNNPDTMEAKGYWINFNQTLVNHFTNIVLQLIHGIKGGQL